MATNGGSGLAPSKSRDDLEAALSSFRTKAAQDIGETIEVKTNHLSCKITATMNLYKVLTNHMDYFMPQHGTM